MVLVKKLLFSDGNEKALDEQKRCSCPRHWCSARTLLRNIRQPSLRLCTGSVILFVGKSFYMCVRVRVCVYYARVWNTKTLVVFNVVAPRA